MKFGVGLVILFVSVVSVCMGAAPTRIPTRNPTNRPTFRPSFKPSLKPTSVPTVKPTRIPTEQPSQEPTAEPSVVPTTPTVKPTIKPSLVPTLQPTKAPTAKPTVRPTSTPTLVPSFSGQYNGSNYELFAVVGGTQCSEALYYGPQAITTAGSADGLRPYFFSTSVQASTRAHNRWLQIVTSDGSNELFRIYWNFVISKNLKDRFVDAVGNYVNTDSVTDCTGSCTLVSTTPRAVSNNNLLGAIKLASQFKLQFDYLAPVIHAYPTMSNIIDIRDAATDESLLSISMPWTTNTALSYNGVMLDQWGPTVVDAYSSQYTTFLVQVIASFLFSFMSDHDITVLFNQVTQGSISIVSNSMSSWVDTLAITNVDTTGRRFKVYISNNAVTANNEMSAGGQVRNVIITATATTQAPTMAPTANVGESVSYDVVLPSGQTYNFYNSNWKFSTSAGITPAIFNAAATSCCFSGDDGMWGAGSGTINGDGGSTYPQTFWGIGNYNSADSSECYKVYQNGVASTTYGTGVKSYMFAGLPGTSQTPTVTPTRSPSAPINQDPTPYPTAMPTIQKSVSPTFPTAQTLFAVVGGAQCAEALYYGPSPITTAGSADGRAYYFSTLNSDIAHNLWTEVVTSDGTTELFRVYWTFSTSKSLKDRFTNAPTVGEVVSYRIEDTGGTGAAYTYSATWRFSDSAYITASKFQVTQSTYGFSADDGAWGGAQGTVNANGQAAPATFWGIGNWDSADSTCNRVYENGVFTDYTTGVKVYMYFSTAPYTPSAAPAVIPTRIPTAAPTVTPTRVPTLSPITKPPTAKPTTQAPSAKQSVSPVAQGNNVLWAVVGGNQCAEALYYGSQAINTAGSVDGKHPYFMSTLPSIVNVPHTQWVQIVTTDGVTELFRIYWTFASSKTIVQRLAGAVSSGETVNYRIVSGATEYNYDGIWRFSDSAGVTQQMFSSTSSPEVCCLSKDDGAWGGALGVVNANGQAAPTTFWGIGNWDSSDGDCAKIYRGTAAQLTSSRVFLYFNDASIANSTATDTPSTLPTMTPAPTLRPTLRPTASPSFAKPSANPTRAPSRSPTARPTGEDDLYQLFAVLGSSNCATNLTYGPLEVKRTGSVDGLYSNYLSTAPYVAQVAHDEWLQIITLADGVTEYMRLYWTFRSGRKTLAQRFADAVAEGEPVLWRYQFTYLTPSPLSVFYNGTWRFSSQSGVSLNTFAVNDTTGGFSAAGGAWGAFQGLVDGADPIASGDYVGISTVGTSSGDSQCGTIFTGSTYFPLKTKTFMHFMPPADAVRSRSPSKAPSVAPTLVPTIQTTDLLNVQTLFAVLGGSQCAEALYYGPQAITEAGSADNYNYYFSTQNLGLLHQNWLQIVTDNNVEQFRIYWTFSQPKTLSSRFADAVASGETVTWRILKPDGTTFTYTAIWRFSDSAGITAYRFSVATQSTLGFSQDDGAWGAAATTVNANGQAAPSTFWGVGNWDSSDSSECSKVYMAGISSYLVNARTYMYIQMGGSDFPTAAPTASRAPTLTRAPTFTPAPTFTRAPTRTPSRAPSFRPTVIPSGAPAASTSTNLFAVLSSTECAEQMYYGPYGLTPTGSTDGKTSYFTTSLINTYHTGFLQVVQNGITGAEILRITWSFGSSKTLQQRFIDATTKGEPVSYVVTTTGNGNTYSYSTTWWFSDSANIYSGKFSNLGSSMLGFSADDGAWGAAATTINANGLSMPPTFWGVGNFNADDSGCATLWMNGQATSGYTPRTLMSLTGTGGGQTGTPTPSRTPTRAPVSRAPTKVPTRAPIGPTRKPSMAPSKLAGETQLFAVLRADQCASSLYYGPRDIAKGGSTDGHDAYFSTKYASGVHDSWLQIVQDGPTGNELMRIYWSFTNTATLADRMMTTTAVNYRVVMANGVTYNRNSNWNFATTSGITSSKLFAAADSTCCLSTRAGAWGVSSSSTTSPPTYALGNFWGIANPSSNPDSTTCNKLYTGNSVGTTYNNMVTYMYYYTKTNDVAPSPTQSPNLVVMQATQTINGVSYTDYQQNADTYDLVLKQAIADMMYGIEVNDIVDFHVAPNSRRRLETGEEKHALTTLTASGTEVLGSHQLDLLTGDARTVALAQAQADLDAVDRAVSAQHQHPAPVPDAVTASAGASSVSDMPRKRDHAKMQVLAASAIDVDYIIEKDDPSVNYASLSYQIQSGVTTGSFDAKINYYAAQQGGDADGLLYTQSDAPETQNQSPGADSSDGNDNTQNTTTYIIIGSVVGGVVVLFVAVAAIVWCCNGKSSSDENTLSAFLTLCVNNLAHTSDPANNPEHRTQALNDQNEKDALARYFSGVQITTQTIEQRMIPTAPTAGSGDISLYHHAENGQAGGYLGGDNENNFNNNNNSNHGGGDIGDAYMHAMKRESAPSSPYEEHHHNSSSSSSTGGAAAAEGGEHTHITTITTTTTTMVPTAVNLSELPHHSHQRSSGNEDEPGIVSAVAVAVTFAEVIMAEPVDIVETSSRGGRR